MNYFFIIYATKIHFLAGLWRDAPVTVGLNRQLAVICAVSGAFHLTKTGGSCFGARTGKMLGRGMQKRDLTYCPSELLYTPLIMLTAA